MSEPSEAAKARAVELANDVAEDANMRRAYTLGDVTPGANCAATALAHFIQRASDAAKAVALDVGHEASEPLAPFILPDDPIVEAFKEWARTPGSGGATNDRETQVRVLLEVFAKRGLRIVEVGK